MYLIYCSISKKFVLFVAIPVYCRPELAPALASANTPTPITTIDNSTSFTCDFGFESTGPVLPYFTCLTYNVTVGAWSAIFFICISMPITKPINKLSLIVINNLKFELINI